MQSKHLQTITASSMPEIPILIGINSKILVISTNAYSIFVYPLQIITVGFICFLKHLRTKTARLLESKVRP